MYGHRMPRWASHGTAGSAVVGLAMAGVILAAGTLLADGLKRRGSELVIQQAFAQEGKALHNLEEQQQGKILELLKEYLFAFADAAIQFDTVPKFDSKVFLQIGSAMPEDVDVERIAFEGYNIRLACSARDSRSPGAFYEGLSEASMFQSVTCTTVQADGDLLRFEIICEPKVSEGRLTILTPEGPPAS